MVWCYIVCATGHQNTYAVCNSWIFQVKSHWFDGRSLRIWWCTRKDGLSVYFSLLVLHYPSKSTHTTCKCLIYTSFIFFLVVAIVSCLHTEKNRFPSFTIHKLFLLFSLHFAFAFHLEVILFCSFFAMLCCSTVAHFTSYSHSPYFFFCSNSWIQ